MSRVPDTHPRVLADLLASLLDLMPGPNASLRRPDSKLAPGPWETCPGCKGERRTSRGTKCLRCEGRGGWHVDPYDKQRAKIHYVDLMGKDKDGRYVVPGVDEEPEGERAHSIRSAVRQLCDMSLPELDRKLNDGGTWRDPPRVDERDEDPLWVALQKQARYRTDQPWARQLEAGLLALEPFERLLLAAAYTVGWFPPRTMGRPLRWRLVLALVRLRDVLPAGFRAPSSVVERVSAELAAEQAKQATGRWVSPADRERRDGEILRLHHLGRSSRVIAGRLGVSQPTVVRVLARARDEREAA